MGPDDRFGFEERRRQQSLREQNNTPKKTTVEIGITLSGLTFTFTLPARFFPQVALNTLIRSLRSINGFHFDKPADLLSALRRIFTDSGIMGMD